MGVLYLEKHWLYWGQLVHGSRCWDPPAEAEAGDQLQVLCKTLRRRGTLGLGSSKSDGKGSEPLPALACWKRPSSYPARSPNLMGK